MIFHFLTGLSDAASYASMAKGVTTSWFLGSLAFNPQVEAICYPCGYAQDPYSASIGATTATIVASILANQPSGDIYLVGFSYGGYGAKLATQMLRAAGRIVHLLLLDPVDWTLINAPGQGSPNPGEAITGASEVVCIYRGATMSPWSFEVVNTPNSLNAQYCTPSALPCGDSSHHGDQCDCSITQQYLLHAFNSGNFLSGNTMNIVVQPFSQTVVAAQPVTFTSTVANTGSGLASAWQSSVDGKDFTNIPGSSQLNATTAVYSIPSVTNSLYYRAYFNSLGQTVLSNAAKLTVTAAPLPPVTPPQAQQIASITITAIDGSTATFIPQS